MNIRATIRILEARCVLLPSWWHRTLGVVVLGSIAVAASAATPAPASAPDTEALLATLQELRAATLASVLKGHGSAELTLWPAEGLGGVGSHGLSPKPVVNFAFDGDWSIARE